MSASVYLIFPKSIAYSVPSVGSIVISVCSGIGALASFAVTVNVHVSPVWNARFWIVLVACSSVSPLASYVLIRVIGAVVRLFVTASVPSPLSAIFTSAVCDALFVTPAISPVSVTV